MEEEKSVTARFMALEIGQYTILQVNVEEGIVPIQYSKKKLLIDLLLDFVKDVYRPNPC